MKILFIFFIFQNIAFASNISFDVGQTTTNFNRFSIPKSEENEVSISDNSFITSLRTTGYFDLASKNQFYFMLAPLEASYTVPIKNNLKFNDTTFDGGKDINVTYKFNSYRVGYLWTWTYTRLRYWLGAVAKIRDAEIKVTQENLSDAYDNIGLVPLVALGFELYLSSKISLFSHTDALGSDRGSAYDAQMEIKYNGKYFYTSLGKRILGGGADNDIVYNFAQFDTHYIRLGVKF